jgi:hypothetical protein
VPPSGARRIFDPPQAYQIAQLSRAIAGVVAQTRATNAGRDTAHRRETSTMAAIGPQDD